MLHPATTFLLIIGTTMMTKMSRCAAFVVPRIRRTAAMGTFAEHNWNDPLSTSSPSYTRLFSATAESSSSAATVLPRVKTIDAKEPTEDPVIVKGWVKTIRKQKTLAFVQVNDGSNMKGIQCVISFDDISEESKKGREYLMNFHDNVVFGSVSDFALFSKT